MTGANAVALKLPPFYKANPAMWFRQVEAQFTIRNPAITEDNTKFAYLLAALPADIAELMEFAVENATDGDKYTSPKTALIKQFGLTKAQKAKKLAAFTTLDPSMTPTTLLMHMRPLLSDSTSEEFLYKFKSVMPPGVRTALAGRKFENIAAYAEAADDVAETIAPVLVYMQSAGHPKRRKGRMPLGYASTTHASAARHKSAEPHANSRQRETTRPGASSSRARQFFRELTTHHHIT